MVQSSSMARSSGMQRVEKLPLPEADHTKRMIMLILNKRTLPMSERLLVMLDLIQKSNKTCSMISTGTNSDYSLTFSNHHRNSLRKNGLGARLNGFMIHQRLPIRGY